MVRHIVMWQLKGDAAAKKEGAAKIKNALEGLRGKISSLKSIEVQINSPDASPDNWDVILISDFDDFAGLAAYQIDPLHQQAGSVIGPLKTARSCVDYEF